MADGIIASYELLTLGQYLKVGFLFRAASQNELLPGFGIHRSARELCWGYSLIPRP